MSDEAITQAVIVQDAVLDENVSSIRLAFFDDDGTPMSLTGADVSNLEDDIAAVEDRATALEAKPFVLPVTTATAIGTAAKTTTTPEPRTNTIVMVKFTNGNSAETPSLAFNGGTARVMKLGGTASAAAKLTMAANGVVPFWFDGTVLHQFGTVA